MPIKIEYQLTKKEYVAIAGRIILRNLIRVRIPIILAVYVIYILLVGVFYNFEPLIWIIEIVGFGVLLVIPIGFSFIYPGYLYQRDPKLAAKYNVEFSDNGVFASGPYGNSNLNWSYYKKAREMSLGYILEAETNRPQIVPKKALDPAQETALRNLLKAKLNFKGS